jgi:hypothetical protein
MAGPGLLFGEPPFSPGGGGAADESGLRDQVVARYIHDAV